MRHVVFAFGPQMKKVYVKLHLQTFQISDKNSGLFAIPKSKKSSARQFCDGENERANLEVREVEGEEDEREVLLSFS